MGGRGSEEIVFGDITNGARGDIKTATAIARRMVCEWGMSEKMGMVEYGKHEDYVFLGRDISRAREYSEATAEQIDQEVRKLLDDAYQLAKTTLIANRDKLEVIAKALLEYETLDGSQIKEIVDHGRLINPPPGASPPPGKKMPAEKPPKQVVAATDVTPTLPGALGGAPARGTARPPGAPFLDSAPELRSRFLNRLIQRTLHANARPVEHVRINHRRAHVLVAE